MHYILPNCGKAYCFIKVSRPLVEILYRILQDFLGSCKFTQDLPRILNGNNPLPMFYRILLRILLRTVPPFLTAHTMYVLRISGYSGFLRNLLTDTTIFLCGLRLYVEKADLIKGCQNSKRKLGVTTHFSEII